MIVENETRWNTADLVALANEVHRRLVIDHAIDVKADTLLLFITLRGCDYASRRTGSPTVARDSYAKAMFSGASGTARCVEIRSPNQLTLPLLDKLVASTNESHLSITQTRTIAGAINDALRWLTNRSVKDVDLSWADSFPIRLDKKLNKSAEAIRRRIAYLQNSKQAFRRSYEMNVKAADRQIETLEKKLAAK